MKKFKLAFVMAMCVATSVFALEQEIGGGLGYSYGTGRYKYSYYKFDLKGNPLIEQNSHYYFSGFNLTPIFNFYPFKDKNMGFEVAVRAAFDFRTGYFQKSKYQITPNFLFKYYFRMVPFVTPFIGAGLGLDFTIVNYDRSYWTDLYSPTEYENQNSLSFRVPVLLQVGVAYDIPKTKLQVYLSEKFSYNIPYGTSNDVNVGIVYKF